MITKEDLKALKGGQHIGVLQSDSGQDRYMNLWLDSITDTALIGNDRFGRQFIISLDAIKKIRILGVEKHG
jgi:hypothetical protein